MKAYSLVMISVTEFVVTVLIGLFGGKALDSRLHTSGRYMTIGVILGFVLGVIRMVIRLKAVMGDSSSDD